MFASFYYHHMPWFILCIFFPPFSGVLSHCDRIIIYKYKFRNDKTTHGFVDDDKKEKLM